jgi:hypothetical protein
MLTAIFLSLLLKNDVKCEKRLKLWNWNVFFLFSHFYFTLRHNTELKSQANCHKLNWMRLKFRVTAPFELPSICYFFCRFHNSTVKHTQRTAGQAAHVFIFHTKISLSYWTCFRIHKFIRPWQEHKLSLSFSFFLKIIFSSSTSFRLNLPLKYFLFLVEQNNCKLHKKKIFI